MPFLYHPLIVHFPVALWLTSFLFDLLFLGTGDRFYERGARLLIGLGLLGAVAAIASGFVDFRPLVAQGIGQTFVDKHRVHAATAFAATLSYLVSFVLRVRPAPSRTLIVILSLLGAGFISATGYIGGDVRAVM
jgi:uncharacterized membrane protein